MQGNDVIYANGKMENGNGNLKRKQKNLTACEYVLSFDTVNALS